VPLLGVGLIVGLLLAAKPVELLAAAVFMGIASVGYVVARRAGAARRQDGKAA